VSAYVGYKLAGTPGAVSAAAGTVLPTTILMLVMVVLFFGVRENRFVAAMLRAVRPVVVGLLLWTAYDMGRAVMGAGKTGWASALTARWDSVVLALASFAVLTFTAVNPVWVILCAAAIGLAFYR
jgi:chromate transporter